MATARCLCAELGPERLAQGEAFVCGRVLGVDPARRELIVVDRSGRACVALPEPLPLPSPGDIARLELGPAWPACAAALQVLTPYRRAEPFPSPGADYYRLNAGTSSRAERLRLRARLLAAVRGFFDARGFVEIQSPQRVACPGLEPQLLAEPAGEGFLITSPEYQLKRLLVAGFEQIYFLGGCWRADERGPLHLNELCMLEWYQAYDELEALLLLTEALLRAVAQQVLGTLRLRWGGMEVDLGQPFRRLSVTQALRELAGLQLRGPLDDPRMLREAALAAGIGPFAADADYDEVFSRIVLERIEPALATMGAVFFTDFPAPLAALARRHPRDAALARRSELYVAGVELANAFEELTDPDEQLARLRADQALRARRGLPIYPIDQRFIEALREGMPPSSGIALGVDRLLLLLSGASHIDETVAFATPEL
ncbi:MAG: EF-P lysine aminoacylase GenX [Proteobacteria bacterium]|nr:EF-P lysine aminoacylase GenX [Pseudomonadota bacterium]